MITYEKLKEVNAKLPKTPIKNKDYVMVKDRVNAFREICPNGTIETEIISHKDGDIVIKATIKDGGVILATGTAWEMKTNDFINKTSYVENCETSAIGRALGFAGFGVDESMASAEEVANAIKNQGKPEERKTEPTISPSMVRSIKEACKVKKVSEKSLCNNYKVDSLDEITLEKWQKSNGKQSLKEWVDEALRKAD